MLVSVLVTVQGVWARRLSMKSGCSANPPSERLPVLQSRVDVAILIAVLWAIPGTSWAADWGEIEGAGLAKIVAGNAVSAKQRALQRAKRDVLEQALQLLISDAQRLHSSNQIEATVFARSALYLRRYRVVHEEQFEDVFSVRIVAICDMPRLRSVLLPDTLVSADPAKRETLSVELRVSLPVSVKASELTPRARELIRTHLGRAGFAVRFGGGTSGSQSAARPASEDAAVSLLIEVSVSEAPQIRGLGWYAARAGAVVTGREGASSLGSWRAARWASEPASWKAAATRAFERAVLAALEPCLATLHKARPRRGPGSGAHRVTIEGLQRLATVQSLCDWARNRGLGACRLDRLIRGAGVVDVCCGSTTAALVSAFERIAIEGIDVEMLGRSGRSIRIRVHEHPPPLPDSDTEEIER